MWREKNAIKLHKGHCAQESVSVVILIPIYSSINECRKSANHFVPDFMYVPEGVFEPYLAYNFSKTDIEFLNRLIRTVSVHLNLVISSGIPLYRVLFLVAIITDLCFAFDICYSPFAIVVTLPVMMTREGGT